MKRLATIIALSSTLFPLGASGQKELFQPTVDFVDMERFSGPWHVIALMPTVFEKDAVNGIETYSMNEDGTIKIEYTFRKKSADGKEKVMYQKGWIQNTETNAEWEIQPLWPIRLPYLIIDLAEDYRYVVIGTNNLKYLWIMARQPQLSEEDYRGITARLADRGYNIRDIQIMPQVW